MIGFSPPLRRSRLKFGQLLALLLACIHTPAFAEDQTLSFTRVGFGNTPVLPNISETFTTYTETFTTVVADFDGVNGLDFAVSSRRQGRALVMLNNGDGTFADPGLSGMPPVGRFEVLHADDIDGDGDPDLVTRNFLFENSSRDLRVYFNDGSGSFPDPAVSLTGIAGGRGIVLADMDGVNGPDLVRLSGDLLSIDILLNDGTGTNFTAGANIPLGSEHEAPTVADFNGDGNLDLVVPRANSVLSVFLSDGAGGYVSNGTIAAAGNQITAGDLDGINGPDLVCTLDSESQPRVDFWLNDGSGSFSRGVGSPFRPSGSAVRSPRPAIIADLDGCHGPDISYIGFGGTLAVYLNEGGGNFATDSLVPDLQMTAYTHHTYQGGFALEDFDNQGGLDFLGITLSRFNGNYEVAFNDLMIVPPASEIQVYDGPSVSDPELTDGQVASMDFGFVSGSATRDITVENSGDADLNISSVDVSGTDTADFAVIGAPTVVAMGATETFQVQFTPGANGARSATLTISSDDADEAAFDFPLAGTGDDTPPVLADVPADMLIATAVDETEAAAFFVAPTATDESLPANPAVACDHESGDLFPIGTTTVTCSATDDAGNTAMETFTVTVIETRASEAGPEDVAFVAGGIDSANPIIRAGSAAAPGGPAGTTFFSVNHAFINNSGEILVEANLTGGPATQNVGLWSNGGGNPLQLVALESGATTGTNFAGTNYKSFGRIALNNAGVVGANLLVKDGGTTGATDRGTFSELSTGTFTGGMREGSTAPGAGTAIFSVLQDPALADLLVAHPGQLRIDAGAGVGGTNDRGIWSSDGTTDSLIIREGDAIAATGIGAGITYGQIENRIVATRDDTIAFASLIQGNGGANKAIFAGQPGNLRLIAARNDTIGGVQIASFAAESLNDAGDVAFRAMLAGQPAATNGAIFTDLGGTQKLIAQEGDAAPGQIAGVVFDRFVDLHLLDGGDMIFLTYLRGTLTGSTNDSAIYRYTESTGTLAPIVREGDNAISTDGAVVRQLRDFDANAAGGVVYTATLVPGIGDATTADNLGMWLSANASLPPLLRARKGDEFVYQAGTGKDPDDVRTITALSIDRVPNPAGGVGSTPKVISDAGEAIIKVSNTLGGGAFVLGGATGN